MGSCKNKVHNYLGLKLRANWEQIHHLYIGLFLVLISAFNLGSDVLWIFSLNWILFWIGAWLIIDDIAQHVIQVRKFDPCYHSPAHRFIYDYLKLYDRAWFRKLNQFADWYFGLNWKWKLVTLIPIGCLIWRYHV